MKYEIPEQDLDVSMIGPLSASQIGENPIAWGIKDPPQVVTDRATQLWLDRQMERYDQEARVVFNAELDALLHRVQAGGEPASVLHMVTKYGASSIERIAGYIGKPVSEVESTVEALTYLGVITSSDRDQTAGHLYGVNLSADFLQVA